MSQYNIVDVKNYLNNFNYILSIMTNKMLHKPISFNITKEFIVCMIPHHEAAIYMCKNLLQYSRNKQLIDICNNIIRMQSKGICEMNNILDTTIGYNSQINDFNEYYNKYLEITKNMIYRMKNSSRSMNIDLDFISEMIPHHEGAITMCKNLLMYSVDPRLKIICENIIIEQTRGVKKLMEVRNRLYNL